MLGQTKVNIIPNMIYLTLSLYPHQPFHRRNALNRFLLHSQHGRKIKKAQLRIHAAILDYICGQIKKAT